MSEIVIYTTDDGITRIDLRLEDGTAWLSQQQIADLFQTSKQNISKHIQAIFVDKELDEMATVNQQLTVQTEGTREVSRSITLYNLDVVSAYFDLAELNAIEHREMRTADYVRELDMILSSTNRRVLDNAGMISSDDAKEKARLEYQKYKAKTLENVEKDYLKAIAKLDKQAKKESRKKGEKA